MTWYAKQYGAYGRETVQAKANAQEIYNYLSTQGWTVNAIAGLLGNIEVESGYNPWRWQSDIIGSPSSNSGYGLTQFTPAGKYINNSDARTYPSFAPNYENHLGNKKDGLAQMMFLNFHADYYPTDAYPLSYSEYKQSELSASELAEIWIYNYERPDDPSATLSIRQESAEYWLQTLMGSFEPRLTDEGIVGNRWYYTSNPFYIAGYGLPNCTCYAWGRRGEILNTPPRFSMGNADTWWGYNIYHNIYEYGQTPKLGAIACWNYTGEQADRGGHVGVVEVINDDGTIVTSNSAYSGTFFYTQTLSPDNNYKWADYVNFQGFIYMPNQPIPPKPPKPTKRKKMPLWFYLRKF